MTGFHRRFVFYGLTGAAIGLSVAAWLSTHCTAFGAAPTAPDDRDSFKYYGPGGLAKLWDRAGWERQRLGRDTWILWTWGNQKFLRNGAVLLGNSAIPISLDFFRLLDTRNRDHRFEWLGLVNEPNCRQAKSPDKYGLWLDEYVGDKHDYYPGNKLYDASQFYPGTKVTVDSQHYGLPSGIVGLRLFDNPRFVPAKWDLRKYFANPAKVEPPYLVGFTCALCHIAFDPTNPPKDPANPRWDNLAANIGNQYLREGELFFTRGRILFGDQRPGSNYADDPYDTAGIGPDDFIYHYAVTQQPGTSETSRISYDFINNPNTINSIFNLANRPAFEETNRHGKKIKTMHILKDGADSVGVEWALMRVPINIGCEGTYWGPHLFNPFTGIRQHPFRIEEVLAGLPEADKKSLHEQYGLDFSQISAGRLGQLKQEYRNEYAVQPNDDFGRDWQEAWRRHESVAAYLMSYKPFHLRDAPGGASYFDDKHPETLKRGKIVFAENCLACHSSKQPPDQDGTHYLPQDFDRWAHTKEYLEWARNEVMRDDFLEGNTLSDDRRYSVLQLGTNMARALATNAVEGDIWAEFSSKDYKALDPVGTIRLDVPVFGPAKKPISIDFTSPGGGRGYYRTPSLVSMWATAPYFHNNGLGDCLYLKDPVRAVQVEGRMADFNDAVGQLLWPERRKMWIKRTTEDCTFFPGLARMLPRLVARELMAVAVAEVQRKLPPNEAATVQRHLLAYLEELGPALEGSIAELLQAAKTQQLHTVQNALVQALDGKIDALASRVDLPAQLAEQLKLKLHGKLAEELQDIHSALKMEFLTIPKGTPVNLYANLNASSVLYAFKARLEQPDPTHFAEMLLKLSDCPDLVEDKGHIFGSNLPNADKNALIEFLKTL